MSLGSAAFEGIDLSVHVAEHTGNRALFIRARQSHLDTGDMTSHGRVYLGPGCQPTEAIRERATKLQIALETICQYCWVESRRDCVQACDYLTTRSILNLDGLAYPTSVFGCICENEITVLQTIQAWALIRSQCREVRGAKRYAR